MKKSNIKYIMSNGLFLSSFLCMISSVEAREPHISREDFANRRAVFAGGGAPFVPLTYAQPYAQSYGQQAYAYGREVATKSLGNMLGIYESAVNSRIGEGGAWDYCPWNWQAVKNLLNQGADVNVRGGREGFTLLHHLAVWATAGAFPLFLEVIDCPDLDVNAVSNSGCTPLFLLECNYGARRGLTIDEQRLYQQCKKLLLERGAR
jgi:hypothetical protein